MGSWDVACSLTGTPIYPGDPCYFVVLKDGFSFRDELLELSSEYGIQEWCHTTYNDYGEPRECGNRSRQQIAKLTRRWDAGRPTPEFRLHFWICEKAWDWCQDHGNLPIFFRPAKPGAEEIRRVLLAFRLAHRNVLAGYDATGQWNCPEDFDSVEANAKLTLECIAAARQRRMEIEKEWDDSLATAGDRQGYTI
jgi:hypothetical protein